MIRSLVKVAQGYSQVAYSKFRVSRTPQESLIFFFKNEITVGDLLDHIRQNFKVNDNLLLASSAFEPTLIGYPILPEAQKATEQMSSELMIPILVAGDFFIYEAVGGRVQLCYGIQCEEFNQTNNRNIPQRVSNGIIELNSEWLKARTVGDALSTPIAIDLKSKEVIEDREEVRLSIEKSHRSLLRLSQFIGDSYSGSPTHTFTVRMLALMTINWGVLFSITYAKYGWDVGEPVSYLTSLGVDLAAMMGFFDLQKQMNQKIAEQQGKWWGMLNIQAQKRSQAWLLSYHRRQFF